MFKLRNLKSVILDLFPIITWAPRYGPDKAVGDLIAGVSIALTLIPQSMGYALLAGIEPQYGLYGSFMGCFVYAAMGTCPQISIGPEALLALLTSSYTAGTNVDFGIFLCFVTGVGQVVAAVAQLGFLVEFVSAPVISGFVSAAAFTIASSQIKGLLGLKFRADSFINTWQCLIQHIGEISWTDTTLSVVCCLTLYGMRALNSIPIKKTVNKGQPKTKTKAKILWFLSVSRNALVVALASLIAFFLEAGENVPFYVTGYITPGLPAPQPPPFKTSLGDKVYTATDMLLHFGTGIIVVPLIGILGNVAIAKAFATEKPLAASHEIISLGVCNIVSSFFLSIPVNGSLSRGALSDASGVKTPGAGIYTGILVILTLLLLTPYFYYIPHAALSSIIVCAILSMVDTTTCREIWKSSRIDLLPLIGCFLCGLAVGIEVGLILGLVIDVLVLLFYNSRPPLNLQYFDDGTIPPHYAVYPVGNLHFAGTERVRNKILSLKHSKTDVDVVGSMNAPPPLVIYCDALYRVDYTFLQVIKVLVEDWSCTSEVIWCNARPTVRTQLNNTMPDLIYCQRDELITLLSSIDGSADRPTPSEPGPSGRE